MVQVLDKIVSVVNNVAKALADSVETLEALEKEKNKVDRNKVFFQSIQFKGLK